MKLPFFSNKKNKTEEKIYYGLFLKEDQGVVLIFRHNNRNLEIIDQEKFEFSNSWENLTEDVDNVLSKLENQTQKSSNSLIIFVYSHFTDEKTQEIKIPYLQKIKKLVKELDLKAIGFIEATEAIVSHLEEKEEAPLTAIIIEMDKTDLTASIFKGGQRIISKSISKTENIIEDLSALFNGQKTKTLLPSRLILYDSGGLDDLSTKILTFHWPEDLFIQLPKVEIIKEEQLIKALVKIFAGQINSLAETQKDVEKKPQKVMDFIIGGDIIKDEKKEFFDENSNQTAEKDAHPKFSLKFIGNLRLVLRNFFSKIFNMKKFPLSIFVIAFVIILSSFFTIEFYLHKAELKVFVPSQHLTKEINLTENIDGNVVTSASQQTDLKDSITTTGKQTIGDKASGDVNIFSFNDKETSLPKGTVLTADKLKFILDSDISIASASEVIVDGSPIKKPGQTKSKIIAESIGPDSNISKGKRFQIGDYSTSTYFALNDAAFNGGTKKDISTVAKKDLETLRNNLLTKAKALDTEETQKNPDNNQKILKDLTEIELTNEQFSKEVGEEAKNVDLKAQAKITRYLLNGDKIRDKLMSSIKGEIRSGYQMENDAFKYQITKSEKKDKEIKLVINIDSKAVKQVAKDELLGKIVMSNKKDLEKLLKNKYQVEGYNLSISNPIPFLRTWLPIFKKNISLKISPLN